MGIEPTIEPWEGSLLPLQHTRGPRRSKFILPCLAPSELPRRSPSVTIHAANVAFVDLRAHPQPAPGDDHDPYVHHLLTRIAVVELQEDRIRDPAIHAWMGCEVADDLTAVQIPPAAHLSDRTSNVVRLVRQVMRVAICGVTRSAI